MTRTQFNKKLNLCMKEVKPSMNKMADKMFNSGAIDANSYEDNYLLVKEFLCAAFAELSRQYRPFNKESQKASDNISFFI